MKYLLAGVKYDNVAKVLENKTTYEGLHNGPPGFYFIIFPSVFETLEFGIITVIYGPTLNTR